MTAILIGVLIATSYVVSGVEFLGWQYWALMACHVLMVVVVHSHGFTAGCKAMASMMHEDVSKIVDWAEANGLKVTRGDEE